MRSLIAIVLGVLIVSGCGRIGYSFLDSPERDGGDNVLVDADPAAPDADPAAIDASQSILPTPIFYVGA